MSVRDRLKQGLKDTFPDASSIFGYYPTDDDWVPACNYWTGGGKYHTKAQSVPQYARKFLERCPGVFDFNIFEYMHEDALIREYNGSATWVLIIWVEDDGMHYIEVECFDEYSE